MPDPKIKRKRSHEYIRLPRNLVNNQVAYRLVFEGRFRFYLLINTTGDFLTLANNVEFCETPQDLINENPHDFSLAGYPNEV